MDIADCFARGAAYETDIPAFSDEMIRSGLSDFVRQPMEYRQQYLQRNFNVAYDGYSYWGQKHSRNQYADDMLHSFVISEFSPADRFPAEMQPFLRDEWFMLRDTIRNLERNVIASLDMPGLGELYNHVLGHMISCNYYPATDGAKKTARNNTRLSEHKDVSLFTVFLFGIEKGLSYRNGGHDRIELGARNRVIIFPGYLMEFLTEGKIKALDHQVDLPEDTTSERYSFAFFSMPKPGTRLRFNGIDMTAEAYYEHYLSLF